MAHTTPNTYMNMKKPKFRAIGTSGNVIIFLIFIRVLFIRW